MLTSKFCFVVSLMLCLLTLTSTARAKDRPLNFTTVDYPGAIRTFVYGTNPAGDIVGGYVDSSNNEHGFLLRDGTFASFDWPGATWTEAYGINPRGDIVGQYGWFDGIAYTIHGFLLRNGVFYAIDIPGQQNTMPFKISPEGMIVGCNHHNVSNAGGTDMNTMIGFSLEADNISHTMSRSMNTGTNPAGDVVGYYFGTPSDPPVSSNFALWSYLIRNGVTTWFQFPGAFTTLATDISPTGTIVGRYRATSQTPAIFRGFVIEDGEFESVDVPGATQTLPFGISASGNIVGYYVVGTGSAATYHGFFLSH